MEEEKIHAEPSKSVGIPREEKREGEREGSISISTWACRREVWRIVKAYVNYVKMQNTNNEEIWFCFAPEALLLIPEINSLRSWGELALVPMPQAASLARLCNISVSTY